MFDQIKHYFANHSVRLTDPRVWLLGSPVCALALCFISWGQLNQKVLSGWLLVICLLSFIQLLVINQHHGSKPTSRRTLLLRTYHLLCFLSGSAWGAGSFIFLAAPAASMLPIAYITGLVTALLSWAYCSFNQDRSLVMHLIPVFVLPTILFAFNMANGTAIMVIVFMIAIALLITGVVIRHSRILSAWQESTLANKELDMKLQQAQQRSQLLSADLNSSVTRNSGLEERLFEQENILHNLLEKAPVGVLLTDLDLRSLFLFGKLSNLIQRNHGNMVGVRVGEAFAKQPSVIRAFHSALQGEPIKVLWHFNERQIEINLSSYRNPNGRLAGVIAVMIDLSEQNRVRKLQENFVANMNHQLRTPLTSVLGFMELLETQHETEPTIRHSWVGSALRNARRMEALIDQVGRLEAEEVSSESESIEVRTLINLIKNKFVEYNTHTKLDLINEAHDWAAIASKPLIESALAALIKNATQHAQPDSVLRIVIRPSPGRTMDQHLQFWVSNRGPAIPHQYHATLFDKFFVGNDSDSRQIYGLGLGLYLARRAVEALKGQIWLERSTEDETLFAIRIPAIKLTQALVHTN